MSLRAFINFIIIVCADTIIKLIIQFELPIYGLLKKLKRLTFADICKYHTAHLVFI